LASAGVVRLRADTPLGRRRLRSSTCLSTRVCRRGVWRCALPFGDRTGRTRATTQRPEAQARQPWRATQPVPGLRRSSASPAGAEHLRAVTSEGCVFDCLPAAFGSGDTTGSRPLPCCRQPASQRPGSPAPARWAGRHHVWIKIKNPACEAVKREAEEDGPTIDGKTRTP
jgi:hypothetical protein